MKLPQLANDYAQRFNLDPTFVAGVARYLREEGLLSQGGRGVNAPDATASDATRLLLPFMVGGIGAKAKDAPRTVRDFEGLVLHRVMQHGVDQPDQAAPGETFGEAVSFLIEAMQDDDMRRDIIPTEATSALYSGVFVRDTLLIGRIVCGDWEYRYAEAGWLEAVRAGGFDPDTMPTAVQDVKRRYGSSIISERHIDLFQVWTISDVLHGKRPAGWNSLPNLQGSIE